MKIAKRLTVAALLIGITALGNVSAVPKPPKPLPNPLSPGFYTYYTDYTLGQSIGQTVVFCNYSQFTSGQVSIYWAYTPILCPEP
jgi:hypothetical protein